MSFWDPPSKHPLGHLKVNVLFSYQLHSLVTGTSLRTQTHISLILIKKCLKYFKHIQQTANILDNFHEEKLPAAMVADGHLTLDCLLAARKSYVPLNSLLAACGVGSTGKESPITQQMREQIRITNMLIK